MSYFTGPALERKIKEYELEELDTILSSLVDGTGNWPGRLGIPADQLILESTRIVIYSIIHKYGLKDNFTVKMDSARSSVIVDLKSGFSRKVRTGPLQLIPVDNPYSTGGKPLVSVSADKTDLSEDIFGTDELD